MTAGRPKLDITDEERQRRNNESKKRYLKEYLKTEKGKAYKKACNDRLLIKMKQNKEEMKQELEQLRNKVKELTKLELPEPPMLGHETSNFREKNL